MKGAVMGQRASQVAEELRKIVSMILLEDLNEPRLGFITITRIEMTDDLRFAKIFYSVLGDETQKEMTREALEKNFGFIKRLAIERINMRYAMDIRFEFDKSIEHSFKIENILKKIKDEEKDNE
jgi:ribosome-binding factor A